MSNNSSSTPTDLIATTNGSGNVKGVLCVLNQDGSGNIALPLVKFYVNGGAAQSVTLYGSAGPETGWVPFNVRFTSSIRVTIQKKFSIGGQMDCAVSWGLD